MKLRQDWEVQGLERVLGWFDDGTLVRPDADELNFVDLVRALAATAGSTAVPEGSGVGRIKEIIGDPERLVFVLVDGLGYSQLAAAPDDAFLRRHTAERLQSVFLTTTAAALTSLATGLWPAEHGLPAWWTRLERDNICAVTLPFRERGTGRRLEEIGVAPSELFTVPSIWPGFTRRLVSITPAPFIDSVYSNYTSGGTERWGYDDLPQAFELAERAVRQATGSSFTYLYVSQYDSAVHEQGTRGERSLRVLSEIDARIASLAESLAGRARIVVAADHGQVNTLPEARVMLPADDPLTELLDCDPTGEVGVPFFHVSSGCESSFGHAFAERWGELYAIIRREDAEQLNLFGPAPLTDLMRGRVGTHLGIAPAAAQFAVVPPGWTPPTFLGIHGGLRPDEMYTPLIVV